MDKNMIKISKGTYGNVYKIDNNTAVKVYKMSLYKTDGVPADFIREILALRYLKHANIITPCSVMIENEQVYMYMSLAKMTLTNCLKIYHDNNSDTTIKPEHYMYQLFLGLEYCHKNGIIHRDIKPDNILITNGLLEIADFGLARICTDNKEKCYTGGLVTRWWCPPEILLNKNYSFGVDIWSAGVILLQFFVKKFPLQGTTTELQLQKIYKLLGGKDPQTGEIYVKKHINLTPAQKDLLYKLLTIEPEKRITAEKAIEHEYFNTVNYLNIQYDSPVFYPNLTANDCFLKDIERERCLNKLYVVLREFLTNIDWLIMVFRLFTIVFDTTSFKIYNKNSILCAIILLFGKIWTTDYLEIQDIIKLMDLDTTELDKISLTEILKIELSILELFKYNLYSLCDYKKDNEKLLLYHASVYFWKDSIKKYSFREIEYIASDYLQNRSKNKKIDLFFKKFKKSDYQISKDLLKL